MACEVSIKFHSSTLSCLRVEITVEMNTRIHCTDVVLEEQVDENIQKRKASCKIRPVGPVLLLHSPPFLLPPSRMSSGWMMEIIAEFFFPLMGDNYRMAIESEGIKPFRSVEY